MRKDMKLGLLLSFVIVVAAGWYYIRKDKTDEPLTLGGPTAMLRGQAHQAGPNGTTGPAKTHTPGDPTASSRRPQAKQPARNRPGGTRRTATNQRVKPAVPPRTSPAATGRATDAIPKPHGEHDASGGAVKTKPAVKTTTADRAKPGLKEPAARDSSRRASGREKRGAGAQTNNAVEELFKFDKPPADSAELPSSPPGTGADSARKPGTQPPAMARDAAPEQPKPRSRDAAHLRAPTNKATRGSRTHTVERGDNYAILAEHYYGSQRHAQFLIDANPQHSDPRKLRPGDVLTIPSPPKQTERRRAQQSSKRAARSAPGARTCVVREGDSFYRIAARELGSGSRWTELFELNKDLVNGRPKSLLPGQVLVLPPQKAATTKKE